MSGKGWGSNRSPGPCCASCTGSGRHLSNCYRMTGAPPQAHEAIYATWLTLGGATKPRTANGVVEAGETAAVAHGIGDFIPATYDVIVSERKTTRIPGVRLRIRTLTREDVIPLTGYLA